MCACVCPTMQVLFTYIRPKDLAMIITSKCAVPIACKVVLTRIQKAADD
jgi:hypothetical protein